MYGSPSALGRPDPRMAQADRFAASQAAMYGAESPIRDTLRSIDPIEFNYKPGYGEDPSQRFAGVSAQQLQKTPAGAALVDERPKGGIKNAKEINGAHATGFSLAAAADLQKQIDALKARESRMLEEMGPRADYDPRLEEMGPRVIQQNAPGVRPFKNEREERMMDEMGPRVIYRNAPGVPGARSLREERMLEEMGPLVRGY